MFLKSLTLKGFKSFADTATLEFEPGVTVVVGPNGSGKSNIVDAVAWVLGAQGPRTLRSSKMEDVIFAGTSKRAGLGRAEVSLTIDNSAGLLPIDLSEVRITRSLWRSGESEYSINGAPCRLLDIQELLSDTGVGRQQHTIVSQAQLDAILAGPTGVVFAGEDPVAPAKAIKTFSDQTKPVDVKAAYIDGRLVDAAQVAVLAALPPKIELLARLVGSLASPLSGLVRVLSGNQSGLVRVLNAIREQKSADQPAA